MSTGIGLKRQAVTNRHDFKDGDKLSTTFPAEGPLLDGVQRVATEHFEQALDVVSAGARA
ncbi:MAG: hypothetical protein U1A22_08275 [Xanthomonadaceae bacterium]|nr:hypothetical protein [Xanthomonadaceae bacterium]